MPENVNLTDDQKTKVGEEVARLKAMLHDVENKISNNDLNSVDWGDVSAKLKSLGSKVDELTGNVVTRESLPPPENKDNVPSVETPAELAKSGAYDEVDDESEDNDEYRADVKPDDKF